MNRPLRWLSTLVATVGLSATVLFSLSGCSSRLGVLDTASAQPHSVREKVVLVHGLGRSQWAMKPLADRLEQAGYDVTLVSYTSLGSTPERAVAETTEQIELCCIASRTPVHFVGHSLGGLLIRAYLAEHEMPQLGRVVLLGTPNHGTPLVDLNRESWWMRAAGPLANALGTGASSFPAALPEPTYEVGVIAGRVDTRNTVGISGPNDGLVSVASTKLQGMQDFAVLPVGHSRMRRDERVAQQTIAFLRTGQFEFKPVEVN